jgi:prepilin-type processing-associated H-X9-DG protein
MRSGFGVPIHWTRDLHRFRGNLLFADAHVEQLDGSGLAAAGRQATLNADWFLPSVQPPSATALAAISPTAPVPVPARISASLPPPALPHPSGKGGASGLMAVKARQRVTTETLVASNVVKVETNPIITTVVPVEPAAPLAPDPEVTSVSSDGVAYAAIYKGAWLMCLLLLLLLVALISRHLRQRPRRT